MRSGVAATAFGVGCINGARVQIARQNHTETRHDCDDRDHHNGRSALVSSAVPDCA
jgi:hypothetical protein